MEFPPDLRPLEAGRSYLERKARPPRPSAGCCVKTHLPRRSVSRADGPLGGGSLLGHNQTFLSAPSALKLYASSDLGRKWTLLQERVTKDHVFW